MADHPITHKAQVSPRECIFCNLDPEKIILENDLCFAMYDQFPVTPFHTLIIPRRHCETFFHLTKEEETAAFDLVSCIKTKVEQEDKKISGFNIGMNAGQTAGQTVMHCHIHLIPRRKGDTPHPRGGVRGVIPTKQSY